MKLQLKIPICFFDLESTGINIAKDRIIEIAVMKIFPNGETTVKTRRINPGIPIPAEATAIHGISDSDVKTAPLFKEVAREYANFIDGADLGGFNILKFDLPLLVEEFLRAGVEFDYERKKIVDAQRIFHLMEKRTLSAAYKFYCQADLQEAHSAQADTKASFEVLLAQVEKYENQQVTDGLGNVIGHIKNDVDSLSKLSISDMVDLAGRMIKTSNGEVVFNFGKHKSKSVLQVLREEPSYYEWILNSDFSQDTKRRLTEIRLKSMTKK